MAEHFIYLLIYFECFGIELFNLLTCDLRDTMPPQRSLTLLPREAEDFPRGGSHPKHMAPLTYLAWLQPICYSSRLVFIHVNTPKVLPMVKTLIKIWGSSQTNQQPWKHKAVATLISNHKLQNNCSLKKCISKHRCTSKMLPQKMHLKT